MSFDFSQCFDENNRPQVLLLHKKSRLSLYQERSQANNIDQLINQDDPSALDLQQSHEAHTDCLERVKNHLEKIGAVVVIRQRSMVDNWHDGTPIIVTVGGDGTLLEASHFSQGSPIFGVNSDPRRSVGAMCVATADTFAELFDQLLAGQIPVQPVPRLGAQINGTRLPLYALNEILIAHQNPAATSRYLIKVDQKEEEQLSSGIWISAPAGSTGAIHSAGGIIFPLDDQRIQYRVREASFGWITKPKLLNGALSFDNLFEITSRMPRGRIFFDGPYKMIDFQFGDRLTIFKATPTWLVVDTQLNRRRMELNNFKSN